MESRLHVCFNQIMQYFKNNEILTEKIKPFKNTDRYFSSVRYLGKNDI